MRARYTAYALGDVDFLIRTTHPTGPVFREDTRAWARELRAYCQQTRLLGLEVLDHSVDEAQDTATVTFRARLATAAETTVLHERSLFRRESGRWLYHSGELDPVHGPG